MTSPRHIPRWLKCGLSAGTAIACTLAAAELGPSPSSPSPPPPVASPPSGVPVAPPTAPPYYPPEDAKELLVVTPEMRRFFSGWMVGAPHSAERLRQLIEAIVLPKGLGFIYDGADTFDPQTAFRLRRGNCVTFSMLVVAMARDFGFEASFQNVRTPTKWDRFGPMIASVQHVNVRVETYDGSYVADLRPDLIPHPDAYDVQVVHDEHAFANFYSDIGFFRLVGGQPDEALHYLILATDTDPRCASVWANRGMLHARRGDAANARRCFERSLRLDRQSVTALVGYVDLLIHSGTADDLRLAKTLEHRANEVRERNPYYHEHLASLARDDGDWPRAESHLRRAIRLKDDDPEFYDGLAAVLAKLGRTKEADRATARALKLRTRTASASVYLEP